VNFGHIFALIFGYLGVTHMNLILIAIAVFIYMAASSEEALVDVKETLKKFRIRDILPREFLTVGPEATLAEVLELVFHSHQEDFPVLEGEKAVGFLTRQDIITNVHRFGTDKKVGDVMRRDFPHLLESDTLVKAQNIMGEHDTRALPVFKGGVVTGVITLEDIGRIYSITSVKWMTKGER
jgi:CBS domain-containing protein